MSAPYQQGQGRKGSALTSGGRVCFTRLLCRCLRERGIHSSSNGIGPKRGVVLFGVRGTHAFLRGRAHATRILTDAFYVHGRSEDKVGVVGQGKVNQLLWWFALTPINERKRDRLMPAVRAPPTEVSKGGSPLARASYPLSSPLSPLPSRPVRGGLRNTIRCLSGRLTCKCNLLCCAVLFSAGYLFSVNASEREDI